MKEKHQLVASRMCCNWGPNTKPRHVKQTYELSVYKTTLQPTEPHWLGLAQHFKLNGMSLNFREIVIAN